MKTECLTVLLLVVAAMAAAQPYAPEYLPELPWYQPPVPPPTEIEAPPEPSRRNSAGDDFIEKFRAFEAEEAPAGTIGEAAEDEASNDTLTTGDYVRVFVSLCVIVAIIILLGTAMRRWGKKTPLLAGAHLGKVLGRVYLDRNVSLHYVETAGQVLVVAVAQNHVSLLATYDKGSFSTQPDAMPQEPTEPAHDFQRQLQSTAARMREGSTGTPADADIQALQSDIARLQRQLREEAREFSE